MKHDKPAMYEYALTGVAILLLLSAIFDFGVFSKDWNLIAVVFLIAITTTLNTRDRKRRNSLPKDHSDSRNSTDET